MNLCNAPVLFMQLFLFCLTWPGYRIRLAVSHNNIMHCIFEDYNLKSLKNTYNIRTRLLTGPL